MDILLFCLKSGKNAFKNKILIKDTQMKKTVLALGIAGTLALSGLSQAGTLSNADKDFLFGSQSVQAKTISVEEMKDTNGEFLWAVPIAWGAVTGGLSYISYVAAAPNVDFSYRDFAVSVMIGAATRGTLNTALAGMNAGFASGLIFGW